MGNRTACHTYGLVTTDRIEAFGGSETIVVKGVGRE